MSSNIPAFGRAVIKELVAKNQSEKVINQLIKLARRIDNKEISNSIIMLSNRFENYVRDTRNGVLSQEEQDVSLAKLNKSILDLIDDLPDETFQIGELKTSNSVVQTHFSEADKLMKYLIMALFALGIVGFIVSMIFAMMGYGKDWQTNIIPFLFSFMMIVTSGFFYFLTKRK